MPLNQQLKLGISQFELLTEVNQRSLERLHLGPFIIIIIIIIILVFLHYFLLCKVQSEKVRASNRCIRFGGGVSRDVRSNQDHWATRRGHPPRHALSGDLRVIRVISTPHLSIAASEHAVHRSRTNAVVNS